MIVVKLMGGLGNQLFQYALGRHLAIKNNTELRLDLSSFDDNNYRFFQLHHFHTNIIVAESKDIPYHKKHHRENKFLNMYSRLFTFSKKIYNEKHFHYDERVLLCRNNTYLYGYWQSEKYFESAKHQIFKEFRLKSPVNENSNIFLKKINNTNSVAVHVRRGDYKDSIRLSLLDQEYYQNAFKLILQKIENPFFYIFSDEIEWCKTNFKFNVSMNYIETNDDLIEFELMRTCKHHIIANSTFSWWAAYLSQFEGKITVAPLKWFKPNTGYCPVDLYLKSWNII